MAGKYNPRSEEVTLNEGIPIIVEKKKEGEGEGKDGKEGDNLSKEETANKKQNDQK